MELLNSLPGRESPQRLQKTRQVSKEAEKLQQLSGYIYSFLGVSETRGNAGKTHKKEIGAGCCLPGNPPGREEKGMMKRIPAQTVSNHTKPLANENKTGISV